MADLVNHPGLWLRDDAAEALARWESDHGWINITSAGRWEWEQQGLINRWDQGGKYNRPPYLFDPKRPASASEHVKNGGEAIDTNEHVRFRATCADYGFWQPYEWDVVHFVYDPRRDKKKSQGGGGSAPASITESEEDDMKLLFVTDSVDGNGVPGWALLNVRTGKVVPMRTDAKGAQAQANGWARLWGNARHVTRQDMLDGIAAIGLTK